MNYSKSGKIKLKQLISMIQIQNLAQTVINQLTDARGGPESGLCEEVEGIKKYIEELEDE